MAKRRTLVGMQGFFTHEKGRWSWPHNGDQWGINGDQDCYVNTRIIRIRPAVMILLSGRFLNPVRAIKIVTWTLVGSRNPDSHLNPFVTLCRLINNHRDLFMPAQCFPVRSSLLDLEQVNLPGLRSVTSLWLTKPRFLLRSRMWSKAKGPDEIKLSHLDWAIWVGQPDAQDQVSVVPRIRLVEDSLAHSEFLCRLHGSKSFCIMHVGFY